MTASGCAANGRELHRFFDVAELGAFVTKSVMADPRSGRGTPRMAETPCGMLNSIGLQGPGIDAFVDEDLAWLQSVGARVAVVDRRQHRATEFADVAATLRASRAFDAVVGVEVNISLPQRRQPRAGLRLRPAAVGQGHRAGARAAAARHPGLRQAEPRRHRHRRHRAGLRQGRRRRPDDDQHAARHGHRHRPDAAAARRRHRRALRPGHPPGRRARHLAGAPAMLEGRIPTVPIIGVGGVRTGRDALELVAAGASAVQVGTADVQRPVARPSGSLRELARAARRPRASSASPTPSASPTAADGPTEPPDPSTRDGDRR